MNWYELHALLLGRAFEKVLGAADKGAIAFVRCLTPQVVQALATDGRFSPGAGWGVSRVADANDSNTRTITADQAVELRESKGQAALLLVDTDRAGAGMDGIYSAAREVDEAGLFREATRIAAAEVTRTHSSQVRSYAETAVKRARRFGQRFSLSPWTEFDFLVRTAAEARHPGELLSLLGLWPVKEDTTTESQLGLESSRVFVDRLLGNAVSGRSPASRIESLRLLQPTETQRADLERFLRFAATQPLLHSLAELEKKPHLWVNSLKLEPAALSVRSVELLTWRNRNGTVKKPSGLIQEGGDDDPPVFVLDPQADQNGNYSTLAVSWRAYPDNLEKDAVEYQISIITDMDEELTSRTVSHAEKRDQKCRFTNDDFGMLNDDSLINAKVVVSVVGDDRVEPQESEEFVIRFGEPPERVVGGVGKIMRTFSEGLVELDERALVTELAARTEPLPEDSKRCVVLRTPQRGKSFRVSRPPLIREVENDWVSRTGEIGRWRVKVRASGARSSVTEFVPIGPQEPENSTPAWDRAVNAARRLAERFAVCGGGVGQVYDQNSKTFDTVVKEYLLAWAVLLDEAHPSLALANTVEVQSLSGNTVGLIVLPSHPLRVAWHVAYDNLVLHTRFEQNEGPKNIRDELALLDGAMFPAYLPGLDPGTSFVFADTLGFHAVGLVPDDDQEPKAAVALLARSMGDSGSTDTAPTVGRQSAQVLGDEILRYIACHDTSRLLHVHALRPGDGLTVAKSLGHAQKRSPSTYAPDDSDEEEQTRKPSFVLELYPSVEQRGVAGRYIAEAREKRRSGAGVLAEDDQWMLESSSLPGGMSLPRLRWARKREPHPRSAAHLAIAFDTFESRVVPESVRSNKKNRPYFAFGLMAFFERSYASTPSPLWRSAVVASTDGEKHPADRTHTERLVRMQQMIEKCVVRNLNAAGETPVLRTEISPEKADGLRELHRLCDWVVTLDRNAGVEYFDSPRDNREIYDAYVIDCVPEREDLGCLQLITSTSNLEEVRNLLDTALDQMGLSRSRRNAEFLLEHLKELSGRLAIRLTGQKAPAAELIALAMCQANCRRSADDDQCWTSLRSGFFVPVDDIRDLLPPVADKLRSSPTEADSDGDDDGEQERARRPDLIHVSFAPRNGLVFRFAEVKYRRHLRTARNPDALDSVRQQVESLRRRWEAWYGDDVCPSFRSVRRAKLARVLRFYAEKARRHACHDGEGLSEAAFQTLLTEIDRMIEKGSDYSFGSGQDVDRGWVFCPEYASSEPLDITPSGWATRIFLFGPDSDFRRESGGAAPRGAMLHSDFLEIDEALSGGSTIREQEPTESAQRAATAVENTDAQVADSSETKDQGNETPTVCLGKNLLTGTQVHWPLTVKGNPHLLVAGLPGMGKTTCLLNLCRQMLASAVRPIVFSYHQDIDEKLEHMVGSVRFIDFQGLGFNPLQVLDRRSPMAYLDVAGAVRDVFTAIFPELGDIQGERIRRAIKESFVEHGWGQRSADQSELGEPPFSRFVEILRAEPKPDRGLKTLLSRLEELDDYGFFQSTEVQESLWDSEQPVVLRIHSTQNDNLQKAFSSLVFYGLYKDMFRRGPRDRITHSLIFDEAHRAARLQLIPTMAKECRKYGISLVLASQEARDFHISVFSAIANYLILRLTETDAKVLARNVASSDQERTLIDRIKQMDRFRAYYCSEGLKKPVPVALAP